MIKVAVIGVGSMGQNHARIYFNSEKTQLVAIADPNQEQVQKIAQKYNTKAYLNYQEMLNQEEIDAISIAVPTSLHKDTAIFALNKGIHVLLEKPIASNIEEAQEIINCAKNNNAKLMIGHIERFNPALLELKQRLTQGELGDIYKIDVQRIGPFPNRISDIGVITDLSVHDLDIINYLTESQPTRIYAETQKRLHPHHEDSVTALIKYQNSSLAVLNINYLSPTKTRSLKIFGKKGMFKVNYLTQELYFYENNSFASDDWQSVTEGDMRKIKILKKEPLEFEIKSFINCILENKTAPVSGKDGLNVLKIANNILKSAREKRIIENENNYYHPGL